MKLRPKSLLAKITWLAIVASLLMSVILAIFVREFYEETAQRYRSNNAYMAAVVARNIHENPSYVLHVAETNGIGLRYEDPALAFSTAGMPEFHEVRPIRRLPRGTILARANDGRIVSLHNLGLWRLMIDQPSSGGPWEVLTEVVFPLLLALAFLWGVFYFMQRRMLAPLSKLRRDMESVGAGVWKQTDIKREDEIGELAKVFNQMQARLRNMIRARQRFLADASHELRSPLARLRMAAEFVQDDELRESMAVDIEEMDNLTGGILDKTRLEGFGETLQKSWHSMADIFEVLKKNHPRAVFEGGETEKIFGDRTILTQALGNLLENAEKFTTNLVRVTCFRGADDSLHVAVEDDGPGVPEEDISHLFEPFYRTDRSRSRDTGGFGLGLAIAAAAADAHGGRITAANLPGGGLRVEISLPQAEDNRLSALSDNG